MSRYCFENVSSLRCYIMFGILRAAIEEPILMNEEN